MVSQASQSHREAGLGFTLVELLLTVALLFLLLGAIVFNFSNLQRGTELDEGAKQIESLLRFARAQAASVGRQVQINFEEDVGEGLTVPLGNLRLLWEPDPLGQPGHFVELPEAAHYVANITDLVSVDEVRLLSEDESGADAVASDKSDAVAMGEESEWSFPPVTFYPDGSTDSVEIVLSSRNEDDHRRLIIRLLGLTGAIQREWVTEETVPGEGESEVAPKTPEPAAAKLE